MGGRALGQVANWVDWTAAYPDLEVKVRARGKTRRTDRRDPFSHADGVAIVDVKHRAVPVQR